MTTATQDAATHAARVQAGIDRVSAMTPEQKEAEQTAFLARIAALSAAVEEIAGVSTWYDSEESISRIQQICKETLT